MSEGSCGICLDDLKSPVSTPCGHLHCEACLFTHLEANADAITGSCPTCRAHFPITNPDLRFVPPKYHVFILPSVRRVFLDVSGQSNRQLQATATRLESRVNALLEDKRLLMERCESAMAASQKHQEGERDARLEMENLMEELRELRAKYENLNRRYRMLRKSDACGPVQAQKRDSIQAGLDSSSASSSHEHTPLFPPCEDEGRSLGRSALRATKRPRPLGSPFDLPVLRGIPAARPALFKKGRRSVVLNLDSFGLPSLPDNLEEDDDTVVNSSGGPQRSGLPTGDIFSPEVSGGANSSWGCSIFGTGGSMEIEEDDE